MVCLPPTLIVVFCIPNSCCSSPRSISTASEHRLIIMAGGGISSMVLFLFYSMAAGILPSWRYTKNTLHRLADRVWYYLRRGSRNRFSTMLRTRGKKLT